MAYALYDLGKKESHYMLGHGWQISGRYISRCQQWLLVQKRGRGKIQGGWNLLILFHYFKFNFEYEIYKEIPRW